MNTPRVLLINPPQGYSPQSASFNTYFPLGILSIASMIRDHCELHILDCLVTDFAMEHRDGMDVFGTPMPAIERRIAELQPDIVGISMPFTAQAEYAEEVAALSRKAAPNALVVFGGPHATIRYEALLQSGKCDYVVVGEGEESFREFVQRFGAGQSLSSIEGVASMHAGLLMFKPREYLKQLDKFPFPAYDLIDFSDYLNSPYLYLSRSNFKGPQISIFTSRGCPYKCVFCSVALHMGRKYRWHSVEYVIEHLKLLQEQYGISQFHFEDDNLSLHKRRFEQILDGIIGNQMHIRWDTPNGVRGDTLNMRILKKIKKSGCKQLNIAVESGRQETLDKVIKKDTSLEYLIEVIRNCRKIRLRTALSFVIGFPGETLDDMRATTDLALKLLREADAIPSVLIATPLYGTELYEDALKHGYMEEDVRDRDLGMATQSHGAPLLATEDFSREDISRLMEEYNAAYSREILRYYLRHPVYAAWRVMNRPDLLKRLFRMVFKHVSVGESRWREKHQP
ncbi:B12-binding domain-containing radical SAM protein [Thiolapillus brandeum]|nr:radical SAM protein [Thiolapillus brandeum]